MDNVDRLERSRDWGSRQAPRYWWHKLPGMQYAPPVYSDLSEAEWLVLRDWYTETDAEGKIGECAIPMISFLHGVVTGNGVRKIVQLGTHAGYSALLLGFMMRRMDAANGLFSVDVDPEMCAVARTWMMRAGLNGHVEIAELNSLDPVAPRLAHRYLAGAPELVIIDSSHEYAATLQELDLWYGELADGGMIVLHDVSRFAAGFDVSGQGGVQHAFREWRQAHPEAETFCLNGRASAMSSPRPLYKDACGLGLIHKTAMPATL